MDTRAFCNRITEGLEGRPASLRQRVAVQTLAGALCLAASAMLVLNLNACGSGESGPSSSPSVSPAPSRSRPFAATGLMSAERRGHTASLLNDGSGRVLVAGGDTGAGNLNFAEIYDPSTGKFSAAGFMVDARVGHTATLLKDGRVLLAGGAGGNGALQSAETFHLKTRRFAATAPMVATRVFHTATVLRDGKVLIVGGSPGYDLSRQVPLGALDSAELFYPSAGRFFSNRGSMSTPRAQHAATLLGDGKTILVTGGANEGGVVQASAELLDTATGIFTVTGTMSSARRLHTATLLKDGTVLIVGGDTGIQLSSTVPILSSAELYDPRTRTFSATGSMNAARKFHTATLLSNGQVLITGGHDDNSAEVYDPRTRQFTLIAMPMVAARDFHTATLLAGGQVLLAGGDSCGVFFNPACSFPPSSPSAELFNSTAGGSFAATSGQMLQPRSFHTATLLLGGKVLIAGGSVGTSQVLNSAELYNPARGTFSSAASMNQARSFHTATVLTSGRILLAGGFSDISMTAINSAELYDPAGGPGGSFAPTNSMAIARDSATATLLHDGRVLIAGGEDSFNGNPLISAEIYDPATGNFTRTAGDTQMPRSGHTATLLPNGTVLISGGKVAVSPFPNPRPIASETAELFDPASGTFSLTTPMNEPRNGHTATMLAAGLTLIAGGAGDLSAEVYDPAAGTFTCVGGSNAGATPTVCNRSMTQVRMTHTATLLADGKVLIAGGAFTNSFNQSVPLASAELFDPHGNGGAGAFTAIGNMTTERMNHTATLLNDKMRSVLIAGGSSLESTSLPSAEVFKPRLAPSQRQAPSFD